MLSNDTKIKSIALKVAEIYLVDDGLLTNCHKIIYVYKNSQNAILKPPILNFYKKEQIVIGFIRKTSHINTFWSIGKAYFINLVKITVAQTWHFC